MDMNMDLSHMREVMYLLHHVNLSQETLELVEDQTDSLFAQYESSMLSASKQVYQQDEPQ